MKKKEYIKPYIVVVATILHPLLQQISASMTTESSPGSSSSTSGVVRDRGVLSREFNWFDDGYDDEDY